MSASASLRLRVTTLLLGAAVVGCADPEPLRVSAAVSLGPALTEAFVRYEERHGRAVLLNTAASGELVQQVRRGAPADLLISASSLEIDELVQEGLAASQERRAIASNRLVVVVPAGQSPPRALDEIARPEFDSIALANPRTAPLGRYSQQALERTHVWAVVAPRCVFGAHARQVLEYVARGEVAAGIVYVTDPQLAGDRVAAGPPLPESLHDAILYEGVVLADSPRAADARALLQWLAGEEGGAFLRRRGFAAPGA